VGTADFIVAAVVLRDGDGRILVVRKEGTSRFMLPGGKIEPGETPDRTAIREAHEELGIDLEPGRLAFVGEWTAPAANESGRTVHGHVYEHPWVPGAAVRNEIAEAQWLSVGDLARRRDIAPLLQSCVLTLYTDRSPASRPPA
jgi:8-oxo-dGTP diphosphatase